MFPLLLLALAASPAAGPVIRLRDTELGRSCSLNSPLALALREQSTARLLAPRARGRADFELALTRSDGQALLRLFDASGRQVLERPLGAPRCSELAVTAGLVLERYLADVEWSGNSALSGPPSAASSAPTPDIPVDRSAPRATGQVAPLDAVAPDAPAAAAIGVAPTQGLTATGAGTSSTPPSGAAAAPSAAAPPGVAPESSDAAGPGQAPAATASASAPATASPAAAPSMVGASAPSGASPRVTVELTAGGGVAFDGAGARGQLAAEVATRVGANLRLSLAGSWLSQRSVTVTIQGRELGTLTGQDFSAMATGAFCGGWELVELCGGAGAGAWVPSAWSQGALPETGSGVAGLPMLAALGRLTVRPWKGARLAVPLGCAFPLGSWQFTVDGTSAALRTPTVSCSVGLQAGWAL